MEVLWKSHGLFCHGMVCYCMTDKGGKEYALKDCWVTEEKRMHEATILEMIKGIPNVVQLVDHWDVYYDGEPDCTACIHSQYHPHNRDDLLFCNRFHRRILLSPCRQPLSKFSSRRELLTAFHAFVVAHRMMIENRVLHGDLSPNNFIIHEGIGYFIDFDHASILVEGTSSTYSHGTGTMPYILIHILQAMLDLVPHGVNTDVTDQDVHLNHMNSIEDSQDINTDTELIEHQPSDDLESLFYIFFEFIAKYGGPHGQLAPMWSQQALPWVSAYEALGKADTHLALSTICFAKMGVLMQGRFFVARTSEYFAEFRPIVQEWGSIVYCANGPKNQVEMTHAGVLDVLDKYMQSLDTEQPFSGRPQSPRSSITVSQNPHPRTGHPPPLAGPSEPLPRRSTCLITSLALHPPICSAGPSEPLSPCRLKQKKHQRTKLS
ncbi:uncharacterized protein F5147DRAFT_776825 [Suillus discolor]|uniref:Protein kinase domain-containing protein n=1 Tax=Suillus discolor TaxID=1912936 RepID=A0A9P7F0I3_9AGAM|nr:uncharacterized protein F5147DRAFT_776825 [Suillus discolor]KAG2101098.1 hypothetical protein F5147DRAFT_776825 [Suillus discolor]